MLAPGSVAVFAADMGQGCLPAVKVAALVLDTDGMAWHALRITVLPNGTQRAHGPGMA